MLTFEGIRRVYEEERKNPNILAKLPENFFEEFRIYLENKKRAVMRGEDEALELETAKRRLESIFEARERKIVNAALDHVRTGLSPQNMLEEEEALFNAIVAQIKLFRDEMAKTISRKAAETPKGDEPSEEKLPEAKEKNTQDELVIVDFKEDVGKFMGIDLVAYGPFRKGDIASVPRENAEVLERTKKGTIIKPL
ncbi:MAG: DNA replication complex GINS family protein [Candidatus Micrarchaeota archaeon]|nr:DNA replication complex GINS family protein [Candidatus Micrarchaeota archaeon]